MTPQTEDERPDLNTQSRHDLIESDLLGGDVLHSEEGNAPEPDEVKITEGGITDATGTVPLGGSSDVGGTGDAPATADVGATTGAGALSPATSDQNRMEQ